MKQIPVECLNAVEKYNGQKVVLRCEVSRRLVTMQGVFRVDPASNEGAVCVDIDSLRSDDPLLDASNKDVRLHLSQSHVDSIAPANDPRKEVQWLVGLQFEASNRRAETSQ